MHSIIYFMQPNRSPTACLVCTTKETEETLKMVTKKIHKMLTNILDESALSKILMFQALPHWDLCTCGSCDVLVTLLIFCVKLCSLRVTLQRATDHNTATQSWRLRPSADTLGHALSAHHKDEKSLIHLTMNCTKAVDLINVFTLTTWASFLLLYWETVMYINTLLLCSNVCMMFYFLVLSIFSVLCLYLHLKAHNKFPSNKFPSDKVYFILNVMPSFLNK